MTDNRPTLTDAVNKLTALGSANQIAQFFQAEGIVFVGGARSRGCPVAQYVRRETGVPVVATTKHVWPRSLDVNENAVLDREGPVSQFIQTFDRGGYPELDAR